MKKYLNLTTNEAIRHLLLKDETIAPETTAELREKIDDLRKLTDHFSVTIVLPTHRTFPDNKQDPILLKNLITTACGELQEKSDKKMAETIIDNIKEAEEYIDMNLNLDSMVLYANEHFASVVKLPIHLEPKVTIGPYFDLSPLYKTRQQNRRYYILSVSRQQIRLIEAFNDKVVLEYNNEHFPYVNTEFNSTLKEVLGQDGFLDNLTREFFNLADKRFKYYYQGNPLPVILQGDVKSVAYFREMMDNDCMVIDYTGHNLGNLNAREIVETLSSFLDEYREERQKEYLTDIENSISAGLLETELGNIIQAAYNGNGDTLYIGNNYTMNDITGNNQQDENPGNYLNKDDALPELLKAMRDNGGNVIYMEDDLLEKYNGIVLVKRF